jgi:hypothetical protein
VGFSRIKYKLYKRSVNVTIVMDNKEVVQKTLRYDINNLLSYKEKAYVFSPEFCYYINGRSHAFYIENDPYPKQMTQWFETELEDRSANLHALKESKIIQELVKGGSMSLILLLLVAVNIIMSIVIMAKLWGAFDK